MLTDDERAIIPLVGPLLPTPRAGKKLINLYRLVRIGVPDGDLDAFTAGPYHAVLLLLAVVVGQPALTAPLLAALAASTGDRDIVEFLADEPCGPALQPACATLASTVDSLRRDGTPFYGSLATYRQWAPRIARYSFHTLTAPPAPTPAPPAPTPTPTGAGQPTGTGANGSRRQPSAP